MKNRTILRDLKQRNQLHDELKKVDKEIRQLTARRKRLQERLFAAACVDEVFEGVALSITGSLFERIGAVDSEMTNRGAEVTKYTDGKYGVAMFERVGEQYGRHLVSRCLNRKAEAMDIAKRWIVFGEVPK